MRWRHKRWATILHRALAAMAKPFAFLDIACGDAGQMRQALAGTKVKHYHGIDLSEPALELAAKNLAGVPFEVELDHRDFVTALIGAPSPPMPRGAVSRSITSSTEGKRDLLEAIHGSTALPDDLRADAWPTARRRDAYLERFRRVNWPAWSFLSDEEWVQIDHHVTTCDFPETARPGSRSAAGRDSPRARIFCDPTGFYRIYRYDA